MGKRHQGAHQDVLLIERTGDIADLTLDTELGYIASHDTLEAWEQDHNQQCKDSRTQKFVQVISDISKTPLMIFTNRPPLEGQSTNVIASRKQDEELAYMNSRKQKNSMVLWVGIAAALFAISITIAVYMKMKTSTNISPGIIKSMIPFLGLIGTKMPQAKKTKEEQEEEKRKLILKKNHEIESDIDLKNYYTKETKKINCIVISEETGNKNLLKISSDLIPANSIERKYHRQPTHLLGFTKDNKLWAIEPPIEDKVNQSPQDCYIALSIFERLVNKVFRVSDSMLEKVKIGLLILLCVVELIFLFLIIAMSSGA
jgi:Txe/YoeB family toxin of Txe-Axe toxin-antitoxin module